MKCSNTCKVGRSVPRHSINGSCSCYNCLFSTLLILYWYLYPYNYHIVPWIFVSGCDPHEAVTFLKARILSLSIFVSLLQRLHTDNYKTVLSGYEFLSQSVLNLNWLPTFKSLKASQFKTKQSNAGFLASGFSQRIKILAILNPRFSIAAISCSGVAATSFERHAVWFARVPNTPILPP